MGAAVAAGIVGFAALWLLGVHTGVDSTLARMILAAIKLTVVSLVTGLVYLLVLRFAAPRESATMMRPLLVRLRVPAAVVNILTASCAPAQDATAIMAAHTPKETEETMAPAPERTGDEKDLPSFDEVLSAQPIPQPSPSPASTGGASAHTPPVPAPDEPFASDAREEGAGAQIPASLAEYGIEPVEASSDGAHVHATAFPIAPPPTQPAGSGYERGGEVNPEDYPHPTPREDAPSTHQIPRVRPLREAPIPAPPSEGPTEVMTPVAPAPGAAAAGAAAATSPQPHQAPSTGASQLIDPTRPALIFGVVLFLIGAIWGPWMATRPVTDLDLTQSLLAGTSTQQSDDEPAPNLTTTPPPEATVTPVISSVQVLSWNNDDGDHPDRAINMIDANPSTSWSSRWFDMNQFRDETAVTIVVKLQKKATVSSVTLTMDAATSGGEIVVRNVTDPSNPRGGTEVATSALSPTTTIKLPTPVETDSIALQFRSMPKGQDGRNWAWISELTVE